MRQRSAPRPARERNHLSHRYSRETQAAARLALLRRDRWLGDACGRRPHRPRQPRIIIEGGRELWHFAVLRHARREMATRYREARIVVGRH